MAHLGSFIPCHLGGAAAVDMRWTDDLAAFGPTVHSISEDTERARALSKEKDKSTLLGGCGTHPLRDMHQRVCRGVYCLKKNISHSLEI